ncbi:MAG: mevalonate kinase [bacterium]
MIVARAPGKVVLWGEYAVLGGAPALAMAVSRFAECRVIPGGAAWRIATPGIEGTAEKRDRDALTSPEPPPSGSPWALIWHALRALPADRLPAGADLVLDTESFQRQGRKLGLGSSAAACVAAYGALCRLTGHQPALAEVLQAHAAFQGGHGSGIDVAAAWAGGLVRFQRPAGAAPILTPWRLPAHIHLGFVWTGRPASTTDHLGRFERWRAAGATAELTRLSDSAAALFDAHELLPALAGYVDALKQLDDAAALGIFGAGHLTLTRLAHTAGVVYKPCGAGGGDLGAAFASDPDALARFAGLARDQGFLPLPLETALHGIEITG